MKNPYIVVGLLFIAAGVFIALSLSSLRSWLVRKSTWEERITRPEITPEEFTRLFAEAVRTSLSGAEVQIIGTLEVHVVADSRKLNYWLFNAWAQCADYPNVRVEVCNRFIQTLIKAVKAGVDVSKPDPNKIVPVIKSELFLENLPRQRDGTSPIFAEQLAGDIFTVYAQLIGESLSFLDESEVRNLNMGMQEVRELAIKNLQATLRDVRLYEKGTVYMITAEGMENASLLLIDKIWEEQAELVDGEVVAAVPCGNMLLFTGSGSGEGLESIRNAAEESYATEPYGISTTLLVRRDGKWDVFDNVAPEK
jgi:uncharacterized protein YtpQ (UPF0354 family)